MPGDEVVHRAGTKGEVVIRMGRLIRVDRSRYTGEVLRDLRARRGCGRSPRERAIREARKIYGGGKPGWMLDAEARLFLDPNLIKDAA